MPLYLTIDDGGGGYSRCGLWWRAVTVLAFVSVILPKAYPALGQFDTGPPVPTDAHRTEKMNLNVTRLAGARARAVVRALAPGEPRAREWRENHDARDIHTHTRDL